MRRQSKWAWFIGMPLLIIAAFFADWEYVYSTHSTPQKAQAASAPGVGSFETVKFAKGVVLITPSGQPNSFTAWYMTNNFWGWRVSETSNAVAELSPQNYNVDFEPFSSDGQTSVWGTAMVPIKEIVYHHRENLHGEHCSPYGTLPFKQTLFLHSEWTMVQPDGKTAPLFK